MKFNDLFYFSLKFLLVHKIRSFLTLLGIIIGVMAVVMVVGISDGGKTLLMEEVQDLGTNLLWIYKQTSLNYSSIENKNKNFLSYVEVQKLKDYKSNLKYFAPVSFFRGEIFFGDNLKNNKEILTVATTPDFFVVRNKKIIYGNNFTLNDLKNKNKVCLIGEGFKNSIFGNITNQKFKPAQIILEGESFTVIGVVEKQQKNIITGDVVDDNSIFIPFTTGEKFLGNNYVDVVYVQAKDFNKIYLTEKDLQKFLKSLNKEKIFSINKLDLVILKLQKIFKGVVIFLGSLAVLSLIVGGIGVMNIMLVSVMERIKDIAICKAVGAKSKDIRNQFLVETILLCLSGAVIGIFLGIVIVKIIFSYLHLMGLRQINLNLIFVKSAVYGFIFAVLSGILFGIYPAKKAANLLPVEGLRYE